MNWYAGWARKGTEVIVRDRILELGLAAWVPETVSFLRQGRDRRPRRVDGLLMSNFVFINAGEAEYHKLADVRGLNNKLAALGRAAVERRDNGLLQFIERVNADRIAAIKRIETGEAMANYKTGQQLQIEAGPLADTLARFKRLIELADGSQVVEVETQFLGGTVTARVDPLDIRAAG